MTRGPGTGATLQRTAGRLPGAPPEFTGRARALLGCPGTSAQALTSTVGATVALVAETRAALAG